MGAQTPAMLELLFEADWAGVRRDDKALRRQIEHFGEESFQAKWLLAHVENRGPEVNVETAETSTRLENKDKKGTKQGFSGKKEGIDGGRDSSRGKGSREPKQGPNPDDIQKWFGDVPW
jgi:hypothetical protein